MKKTIIALKDLVEHRKNLILANIQRNIVTNV